MWWITKRRPDRFYRPLMGRGKRSRFTCGHDGPALVRQTDEGSVAVCLLCDTVGPPRETAGEARQALQDLADDRREQ
ncbi:hypothetical protein GBA65_17920 [Rubrobacter marinus]|uniref:Uncharacterized protein n=1 Tax=Rubrobacter marinus TaxID=2653852 RepID=A0A6G8Q0U3_9ACTN|nr:hypothetical protein GBA65_17920 [Rubrobacter marinus]